MVVVAVVKTLKTTLTTSSHDDRGVFSVKNSHNRESKPDPTNQMKKNPHVVSRAQTYRMEGAAATSNPHVTATKSAMDATDVFVAVHGNGTKD